ncbi:MAG: type IV toxin-antitoxin system AbiEi family antitoxin domain-containing protein [Candidatus Aminicenantes bacterium]|nr:type IV toxin-antitoxin system AbiEi family antitoxin domain-containing protein [Candidatus Aminicenantes bacterium]
MKLIDVHKKLIELNVPVFHTSDAAACLNIEPAHASKLLARLASSGHIVHLSRGMWAFKEKVEILALPEYLTKPFPSYVSLQSALYYHGMISQIPSVTYAVSIGRTKKYKTPLGVVSIHHVNPSFFFGYQSIGKDIAKIATPEKALIDYFYLSPARSHLFKALPELELPQKFSIKKAYKIIDMIKSKRRKSLVMRSFLFLKV